jgi:hypothetical protein
MADEPLCEHGHTDMMSLCSQCEANSPNSSPELTEVERVARWGYQQFQCFSSLSPKWDELDTETREHWLSSAAEALSSKNELPSFTCDMCDDPATCPAENCAFRSKETILSLQRRLDERDALLRDARHFITPCFSSGQALLVKIDAALNSKDTGR